MSACRPAATAIGGVLALALCAMAACRERAERSSGRVEDARRGQDAASVASDGPRASWSVAVGMVEPDDRVQSVFAPDVVLLRAAKEMIAVDPESGAVRWRRAGDFVHAPRKAAPLYRVRRDLGPVTLVSVDPLTGNEGREVALPAEVNVEARIYLVAGGAIAITERVVRMIDLPGPGATSRATLRWAVDQTVDAVVAPVSDGEKTVVLSPALALTLRDGRVAWRAATGCTELARTSTRTVVGAGEGCRRHRTLTAAGGPGPDEDGELVASVEDGVVLDTDAGLSWSADGAASQRLVVPRRPGEELTAVSVGEGVLLYFSTLDRTLWMRSLAGGEAPRVYRPADAIVISTEHDAVREGGLFVPPAVEGRRVYVYDRGAWQAFDRPAS